MIAFDDGFRRALLAWFDEQSRELPWRGGATPYATMVSELMLQQTRVDTVIGYFHRWMERFPDVTTLASASEEGVLNAWQGLGYYRRARALHRAAQLVVANHGGQIPSDAEQLRGLPGVGPYTAGAIASIAFDKPEPAIDGNVFRVLSRLWNDDADTTRGATRTAWQSRLKPLLQPERAGDFNQALIELGALVCRPGAASECMLCPVRASCAAWAEGTVSELPVKKGKTKVRRERRQARVVQGPEGVVLLARRRPDGLLGGLWEFPLSTWAGDAALPEGHVATVTHRFSHIALTIEVGPIVNGSADQVPEVDEQVYAETRWVRWDALNELPLSTMMTKIVAALPAEVADEA